MSFHKRRAQSYIFPSMCIYIAVLSGRWRSQSHDLENVSETQWPGNNEFENAIVYKIIELWFYQQEKKEEKTLH